MHRTKTDAALADAEAAHADDPERAELLRRARRFKASWIELAEVLTSARRNGRWKGWGYDSFESYAREELRLKPETVDKLTGSYTFLQRRAPAVLQRDVLREAVPSYQAVDFLRRAEESDGAPQDALGEIRRRVLDDAASVAAVTREYGETVFPIDDKTRRGRDAAAVKNVAKRLRELLAETHVVPKRLASEVGAALDRLLEAVEAREERAA